jgi:hypothetical protein
MSNTKGCISHKHVAIDKSDPHKVSSAKEVIYPLTSPHNILPNRLAPPQNAPMMFHSEGSSFHVPMRRQELSELLESLATGRETQMHQSPIRPQMQLLEDEPDSNQIDSYAVVPTT